VTIALSCFERFTEENKMQWAGKRSETDMERDDKYPWRQVDATWEGIWMTGV